MTKTEQLVDKFKALLKKYIEHVNDCEGSTFINRLRFNMKEKFTAGEIEILEDFNREVLAELFEKE